jgi:hypothetical protein
MSPPSSTTSCAPHPEDEPEAVGDSRKAAGRARDSLPGTFRLKRNESNDYMIDRQMQKTQNFTGITGSTRRTSRCRRAWARSATAQGIPGTSDKAIVAMRRLR